MLINNIRCDWHECRNLTNRICKLEDFPEDVLGNISPSYTTWVKICGAHEIKVPIEQLDFVVDNPHHWPEYAPYSYRCVRCDHVWESIHLRLDSTSFGKIPSTCPNCHNAYWYKRPRFKREKGFIETEVYHKVGAPK